MQVLQTNFDERLKQMFETMQTTMLGQTMSNNTINGGRRISKRKSSSQNSSNDDNNTTVISVTNLDKNRPPNITAQEIKDIIKAELQLFQSATLQSVQNLEQTVNDEKQIQNDEVFLMPEIPLESIASVQQKPQRRSKRLSSIQMDEFNNPRPARRSIRLQSMEMMERETPKIIEKPSRRSIRIQSLPNTMNVSVNKVAKIVKPKSKINPLTDYFINGPTKRVGVKEAKKYHKDSVLKLLNNGTLKELQILPLVGLKTAYQIIFQR